MLVGVESAGFVLRVSLPAERTVERVLVAYPQPLENARDLHKVTACALACTLRLTQGHCLCTCMYTETYTRSLPMHLHVH